jgi:hypothetical protein
MLDLMATAIIHHGTEIWGHWLTPLLAAKIFVRAEKIRGTDKTIKYPQPSDLEKYCKTT